MKKIFLLLTSFILLLAFFWSCEEKVVEDPNQPVQVAFVLNNPAINNPGAAALKGGTLKAGGDESIPVCSDGTPTSVHLVGTGPERALDETLDLLQNYDDGKQTVLVKMVPGDYTITQFEVLDENGTVLWASPLENSYYADLFNFTNNVEVDFTLEPFTKKKVDIDVLCWKDYAYEEFGYVWFDFHNYEIHTLCFFGDVCTKFFDSWSTFDGSPYSNVSVEGYDFPALFTVNVWNNDDPQHTTTSTNIDFVNATGDEHQYGGPVCVEYLDNLEVDGETYTAQIVLTLPDGTQSVLDEIQFTEDDFSDNSGNMDDVSSWGGDDGIWEFAVGDCAMAAQQEDINGVYNIPWVPLPTEMTFKLVDTRPQGYFALGNIQPDAEVGEFVTGDTLTAWCGAEDVTISWNHTYKAHVYPYFNIPSGSYYDGVTDEQWAKLNWLANTQIPVTVASTTQMNQIQNAIWEILGQPNNGSGSSLIAGAPTTYIPPLGGYIVVVVDPYDDITNQTKCSRQYQLAIVRFDP